MSSLKGRVAVITGGNSGIGKATAQLFAREGAQVIVTGRRQEILNAAVEEIGHGAIGVCGDVADLEHHGILANEVKRRFGGLDVYMANAAVINLSPSARVTAAEYDEHFAINARGVFFGVQAIIPVMRDGGSIILTSSLATTKVLDNHAVYAGSKAAITAFAKNWALELKSRRIRVNVLSPGPTETAILTKLGIPEADRPEFLRAVSQMIPAGRMGKPEELASAALFLASGASSFVNGTELHVDGGMALV